VSARRGFRWPGVEWGTADGAPTVGRPR
jgi:hypothetical protein